eukprot:COSAG01_NODE_4815_length_4725_cov_2.012970_3_plen_304_part_00
MDSVAIDEGIPPAAAPPRRSSDRLASDGGGGGARGSSAPPPSSSESGSDSDGGGRSEATQQPFDGLVRPSATRPPLRAGSRSRHPRAGQQAAALRAGAGAGEVARLGQGTHTAALLQRRDDELVAKELELSALKSMLKDRTARLAQLERLLDHWRDVELASKDQKVAALTQQVGTQARRIQQLERQLQLVAGETAPPVLPSGGGGRGPRAPVAVAKPQPAGGCAGRSAALWGMACAPRRRAGRCCRCVGGRCHTNCWAAGRLRRQAGWPLAATVGSCVLMMYAPCLLRRPCRVVVVAARRWGK